MPTAIIFGATGAVGRHVLVSLLSNNDITKVAECGRRVTPLDAIRGEGIDKSKLVQKTIDFEKLDEEPTLQDQWDIVYITYVKPRL
jgi:oxidoreductase